MDDMRFYVLFNSISVMSGWWRVNNERLCAMKLVEILFIQTTWYVTQMQYMFDFLQTLFHMAILGGEGTVLKISTTCNRWDIPVFQTMSELSAWPACCHTDWFCTRWAGVSNLIPPVHKNIYSDHFIWYEKAFLTCPMDLVSNRKSVIRFFVQVSPASYEGQR